MTLCANTNNFGNYINLHLTVTLVFKLSFVFSFELFNIALGPCSLQAQLFCGKKTHFKFISNRLCAFSRNLI